jgi:chromosome segregation ATPase
VATSSREEKQRRAEFQDLMKQMGEMSGQLATYRDKVDDMSGQLETYQSQMSTMRERCKALEASVNS